MNFKFLNYNEDILSYIKGQESYSLGTLFVCENLNNKLFLEEKIDLSKGNKVITKDEFLSNIKKGINDDNIRFILFFLSLSKNNKKKFRINDLFDCKDLFNRFKSFYNELLEADIKKPFNLLEWQEKIFNEMEELKEGYINFINKKSIKDFLFNEDFDIEYFENFTNIIFVNVLYFSNLDKKSLKLLNKNIEIILQLPENNFDKENLKILKVEIPNKIPETKIYKTNDDFLQSINILKNLDKNTRIIDLKGESFLYSVDSFKRPNETFKSTRSFNFLEDILKLLKSVRIINEIFSIKASTILNIKNSDLIKEIFNISENDLKSFDDLVKEGYKYIPKSENFIHLFETIENLYNIKNFEEFYNFFINFKIYEKENNILYETLNELKHIGKEFLNEDWNELFKGNFSRKILTLLLEIVSKKEIRQISPYLIEQLGEEEYRNVENLIMFNLSDAFIKYEELEKNFLSDIQKSNNGIKDYTTYSLEQRYKILRNIFSSKNVFIYYIKDIEKNIDSYPLVEELKLKFNIEDKNVEIDERYYSQIFNKIFKDKELLKVGRGNKDPLSFEIRDLNNKKEYSLSFYEFEEFEKCQYKYYLKFVASLQNETQEIKYRIEPSLVGEISHKLLSRVAILMDNNLRLGNYNLKAININKILDQIVKEEKYKIPITYYNFYKKILYPSIIRSVKSFYLILESELKNKNIKEIIIEKMSRYNLLAINENESFYLKGKADLIIETDEKNYIIDYKTGKTESKQLDFYKIIYYNLYENVSKMFYKVFEEELKIEKKEILKEDIMKEKIVNFLKGSIYKRTDKKSYCRTCEYFNICHSLGE